MTEENWSLAHEYGEGCKVYADRNSLTANGHIARINIKHYLVPPGTDKRNQKKIREVVFDKEFDLDKKQARYHSIIFIYMDGLASEPMKAEPQWTDADKGTLAELNYVQSLVSPKRKRWWPF